MKSQKGVRAIASLLLCGLGAWLALPNRYREKTYLINAGGCRLETTVVEKPEGGAQGTVVLFHGLSANKKVMSYVARGFAEQNLRVYVPDLPGHGHSKEPFSPERAEECGEALLRQLLAGGMTSPDRTIVAGHSMGGAIALRIASRVPVAGVVAISPAPMRAAHGASAEMLLFQEPGLLPPHFLVISGTLELESMRGNAFDLVASRSDGTAKYIQIYGVTHAGLLFSPRAVRAYQDWTRQTLHLTGTGGLPSLRRLFGALAGFLGILLLANPFLQEATGKKDDKQEPEKSNSLAWGRMLAEFALAALLAVVLLRYWNPLPILHLFQGDYLASFLLLLGTTLLAFRWRSFRKSITGTAGGLLGSAFGAITLFLLVTGWLELSIYEAWMTREKWVLFLILIVVVLPYHFAEEALLGPVSDRKGWRRQAAGLSLRLAGLGALAFGVFYLRSGETLLVLLAPYFVLLHGLLRRGMDIVREKTGSAAAAAVFGAILLAGFCLVIFPIT